MLNFGGFLNREGIHLLSLAFFMGALMPSFGEAAPRDLRQTKLPFPIAIRAKVDFWKAVYTKYTTRQGLLHDADDLTVVYEAIQLQNENDLTGVNALRQQIREQIFNILRKRGENLSAEERRILSRFPAGVSRTRLLQASENIRFQLGQSSRFLEGIKRSNKYIKVIERIFEEENMPDFLKYLPHVESSFQENAMSKFGAAGLWQFMPETGRLYLKVSREIDERLDPWIASRAAARHLRRDYDRLGEWSLALTAYNHGTGGIERAVKALGTTDIAQIAFNYQSPSFGFASRNFYAQFLAAVEVATNYRKYFGEIPLPKSLEFEEVKITKPTSLREIAQKYDYKTEDFKQLNPGLRRPVYDFDLPIPAGVIIRVPPHSLRQRSLVASVDRGAVKAKEVTSLPKLNVPEIQIPAPKLTKKIESKPIAVAASRYKVHDFSDGKGWVHVGMNETVFLYAEWLGVTADEIRGWNGMDAQGQARLGQKLLLKFPKGASQVGDLLESREQYHRQIREDFFQQFEVKALKDHIVQRGENLWSLCFQRYDIPPWLLEEHNPRVSLTNLAPGTKIKVPELSEKFDQGSLVDATP